MPWLLTPVPALGAILTDRLQVVIVLPPFADAANPALGPSLLATACRERGLSARVLYANLHFAAEIGFDLYQRLALSASKAFAGETIFRNAAFPDFGGKASPTAAIDHVFGSRESIASGRAHGDRLSKQEILRCQALVPGFIDAIVKKLLSYQPDVVGFSSVFEQSLSSIALARNIKRADPGIVTVLGGGNAEHPMGAALADLVPEYDMVFSGEADLEFPAFCGKFVETGRLPERRVVVCSPVESLDELPIPDYQEYYSQLVPFVGAGLLPESLPEWLYFETSRGCWYGAKNQCKFCGLKGLDLGYRTKSPERAFREIKQLVHLYEPHSMAAVDNIMPHEVRRQVLPMIVEEGIDVRLFYEVKANLTEEDLDQFIQAGVSLLQPGVESFSSNILKQTGKGVSGVHNLWLLRECSSRHIMLLWNFLTGIPGERRDDYEKMLELLPAIEHLEPPNGWGRIRLDRYSPYFSQAEEHGFRNVRPREIYENLYPPPAKIDQIAYYFRGDYSTEFLEERELRKQLNEALDAWATIWEKGASRPVLVVLPLGQNHALIRDTRRCAVDTYFPLTRIHLELLRTLERPVPRGSLGEDDREELNELLTRRFAVEHEGRVISVVTDPTKGDSARRRRPAPGKQQEARTTMRRPCPPHQVPHQEEDHARR
jgi:ribosomal peptide maturation radical SAM protein 1